MLLLPNEALALQGYIFFPHTSPRLPLVSSYTSFLPQEACQSIKTYMEGELGRYIVNVTTAAQHCSQELCHGHGRCLRKDSNSNAFLHLNPATFRIQRRQMPDGQEPLLWADGEFSSADTAYLRTHFQCHCYLGWEGEACKQSVSGARDTFNPLGVLDLLVLMTLALLTCLG